MLIRTMLVAGVLGMMAAGCAAEAEDDDVALGTQSEALMSENGGFEDPPPPRPRPPYGADLYTAIGGTATSPAEVHIINIGTQAAIPTVLTVYYYDRTIGNYKYESRSVGWIEPGEKRVFTFPVSRSGWGNSSPIFFAWADATGKIAEPYETNNVNYWN